MTTGCKQIIRPIKHESNFTIRLFKIFEYDVEVIYDDYDYINEEFYGNNNELVEEVVDNVVDDEVTDDIVFRDERSPEAINSTIQWLENIMGSTGSVNDLFNQCKKTDDENNE